MPLQFASLCDRQEVSRGSVACWILARIFSLVTWSLYEMCSILRQHLISIASVLLWSSAVWVHDSQAYRKRDVTRERISRILELREILLSIQTGFSFVNAAVVCAILESIFEKQHVLANKSLWLENLKCHLNLYQVLGTNSVVYHKSLNIGEQL